MSDENLQGIANDPALAELRSEHAGAVKISDNDAVAQVDPLTAMTAERDALKDQLLRALADTENMRRRSERGAKQRGNMATHNLLVIWLMQLTTWLEL